jgi:diguanylate cyclase (GGDEF)-like protein/PAS domain S-box-containing protein
MNIQAPKTRRNTFVLIVLIVVFSALATTAYSLWRSRVETVVQKLDTAALTVRALEDHLTQSFNIIDRTLVSATDVRDAADISRLLRHAPYLRSISLVDKTDKVSVSSFAGNLGTKLARNDYLPISADPVSMLRVGELSKGRDFYDAQPLNPDKPPPSVTFIPVIRDVTLAGSDWRTVVATVNTDYFLNFYSNYIGPDIGIVDLLRYDGKLLLSTDESQKPGMIRRSSQDILARVDTTEAGQFEAFGENGKAILIAYRASRIYPFVLVVQLDKKQALAGWQQEAVSTLQVIGAVLLMALTLAGLYFVRFERLARKQEVDQEQLRIAAIAFETHDGMVVTNAQANVLKVNLAFSEITGYSADEVIGQELKFLMSGKHNPAFYADICLRVKTTGVFAGEVLNRHKDGSIHPHFVRITAVLNREGDVSHFIGSLTDITARKKTEESLLTLSQAVEQSPVSIIITDPEGIIEYVNPRFEAATGYPLAEVIGQSPRLLSSGEKSPAEYRAMWADLKSGKTWQGEFHNRRKDGSLFWELASISPVFSDEGELLHFVAVKEDISERRLADEKISELNRDFVAFLENTSDFIYFKDKHSRFRFCSQTLAQITGHGSWRDMIGKHDLEVFPADTAQVYFQEELPVFRDGKPLLNKIDPYYDESGKPGWVNTSKWPLFDPEGKVVGLFGISHDITEQKLSEEKLLLAASVFTHAREGIMITTSDGLIIDVNEAFTRITGYARDDVLGKNPRILSSGRQSKDYYTSMWTSLISEGYWYGEVWNRRKNGEVFAEMQTISTVWDQDGKVRHYVALFSDITVSKNHEKQLEQIAHYDALTGLANRVLLADRMHQSMAQALRRGQPLAVAYLDLDGFKTINDTHGHDAGDQLLMIIANRMKLTLRDGDTLARLGGDEFVAVLFDLANLSASVPILKRLLAAAAEPVNIHGNILQVSASIGVTFYPQTDIEDADQLLRQADQAMYQAKVAGKNRFHVFDTEHDRNLRGHHESLEDIERALAQGEFVLYYQPKVNMRTGAVIGAEALIRWQHPTKNLLAPAMFLPAIENHPLIEKLGDWVIETALAQMDYWHERGLSVPVSVNVAARQLQQADFVERLRCLLAAHPNIRPGDLELEVLETSALEDLEWVSQIIRSCKEIGVSFALDDFGTGYSSLTYLKRLAVHQLKIDQSFVLNMLDDPDDLAILEGVLGLANAFQRQVIAEGVETVDHGEMLLRLGCDLAQGYGIARPMTADDLPGWIATWSPDPSWHDLPVVSSVDLPVIFSSTSHRAWVSNLEKFLRQEKDCPPEMNVDLCRLGSWINTEGRSRYGADPAFTDIGHLHQKMHELARDLCELAEGERRGDALDRMCEIYYLRDRLLDRLKMLIG